MATTTGARGTTLIGTDQRYIEMDKVIRLLEDDAPPLTQFLMNLKKSSTGDPKFKHTSDTLEPRFDAVNNGAGYASGATSIVVDNGSYFAQHDNVVVTRTGELMRVTAVSTNTLTVVRGVGSTAAAIVDNDELLLAGSAQPEGDTSKPARSSNPTSATGYTQIFRRPWELTETALASQNTTTPHDWDHQAKKVAIEHKKDMNRAFLFNQAAHEDTSGSQARRFSAGLFASITTNVTDAGGALTETEFLAALRTGSRYSGGKTKMALASPLAASVLQTYPAGKVQVSQSERSYGIDVRTFTSPFGALRLVIDWELEGARYGGYLAALNFDDLGYRYLANEKKNRDSHVKTNIQAPDAETRKDEWRTEAGLQVGNEKKHFLITGITG